MRLTCALAAVLLMAAGPSAFAECNSPANEREIDACVIAAFNKTDEALNKKYKEALAFVGKDYEDKLRKAQRAWLAFRDAHCRVVADITGKVKQDHMLCLTRMTEQRTYELDALLKED